MATSVLLAGSPSSAPQHLLGVRVGVGVGVLVGVGVMVGVGVQMRVQRRVRVRVRAARDCLLGRLLPCLLLRLHRLLRRRGLVRVRGRGRGRGLPLG